MFFFGGGKCPNLGVVNVRILGVVNVLLANDSQSPDTPHSHTKMTVKIVTIMMMMMVTMMTMMMTLSSGEGEHKHSGEVNRPLSATCQPTYNHSRCRKSCDDVGRGDNYCDDDDKDEADDNVDVRRTCTTTVCPGKVMVMMMMTSRIILMTVIMTM